MRSWKTVYIQKERKRKETKEGGRKGGSGSERGKVGKKGEIQERKKENLECSQHINQHFMKIFIIIDNEEL